MTLTIDVAPEVERALQEQARRNGETLPQFVGRVLAREATIAKPAGGGVPPGQENSAQVQADAPWAKLLNNGTHNAAILELAAASEAVRASVMQRSVKSAAHYYATPEGQADWQDMADWRALTDASVRA